MNTRCSGRGFSRMEALVLVAGAPLVLALAAVAMGVGQESRPGAKSPRDAARTRKDATQIRGLHQAMVTWAQNNEDRYPLPSKVDKADATVKEKGAGKDITANIYSMLIYSGSISPEMLVSPVEKNPAVVPCETYVFDMPPKAANPAKAIWDPAFKVSLGPEKGHASYAHLQPSEKRLKQWSNTFNHEETVLSTRGPEIASVKANESGRPVPTFAKPDSLALTMLGDGTVWTGHVVHNDNHVQLLRTTIAHGKPYTGKSSYTDADGKKHPDLWFFNEPGDTEGVNTFLGLFTKAGDKAAGFKAIWD
ncbi:MAG: hypothetical protein WD749_07385 [Phycisphaerales bacterium]